MKRWIIYVAAAGLLLCGSCQRQLDYTLEVPVCEAAGLVPNNNEVLDLNDIERNEFVFSWTTEHPADLLLLVSEDPMLGDAVRIEVGQATSYAIPALDFDMLLVRLNITAGEEKQLYWGIKEKAHPEAASREIAGFIGRRAVSKLLAPTDLTRIALYREELAKTLHFEWNTDGMPATESYTLCISPTQNFSGDVYEIPAGAECTLEVGYERLQEAFEQLGRTRFETAELYWNIRADESGDFLSRTSSILYVDGIMEFTDVRGDERITYRVTKLTYPNGKSVVWLADNLRTVRYPDGSALDPSKDYIRLDGDEETERFRAYGCLYSLAVSKQVVPDGWRIPSVADYEELFSEAAKVPGGYNVLKDNVWYGDFPRTEGHVNEWRMNLSSAGRLPEGTHEIWGYASIYCYLIVSDMDDRVLLHDNGDELWKSANDGAALRLIYVGND